MRVAIIGAGLQGTRRAFALQDDERSHLVVVADSNAAAAQKLAARTSSTFSTRWEEVIDRADIDVVIVCTPPHLHAPISISAMRAGKHVLCEKPLARTVEEAEEMVRVSEERGVVLKCGFNLRHHPVVAQLRRWVDAKALGDLFFIRARYGIGGRSGYDQEWRARSEISGGGQLMDQGIHLLDLCRWFLGEFNQVSGCLATYFWKASNVEDNAFALLRTRHGQIASIHVSWTQWKPLFSFEIFGGEGYAVADGLGGAYGTARATLGRRDFVAPFTEEGFEYRGDDISWRGEWREMVSAITQGQEPLGNGRDGLESLRLVRAIYQAAGAEAPRRYSPVQ